MDSAKRDEHHSELLQSQAHIWSHIFKFIDSMSLLCAVQFGLPDIIHSHGKPMTLSQISASISVLHPSKVHCLSRLMRILVHSGFFERRKLGQSNHEEGFVLTNASQLLLKNNPFSVTPFLLFILDPILTQPWEYLSAWFQNDDTTPFKTAHGRMVFEYARHEPRLNNFLNEAMASDARLIADVLINDCKGVFQGLTSLVDVGGGTGTIAKAIAVAFPNVDCTVFDLPHVVANLQDCKNLKYVGGDMFQAVPPAHAILLKWILHDWNDEECVKILEKCKEAIDGREGGKLIIIDMVMGNKELYDKESIETQLQFDMLMMVLSTGQERKEKEWAKIIFAAGFTDYKIIPMFGLRSLIEVYP
ncbi:hypothetical protein K2173_015493 [Erythroxylum novogranatense]|uniref:Trans-resveratrol di-O-methyltransferase-like n=1 Tax=Erythroxylum novogranatense TaxID=1862640 RepID=A0AAV8SSK8_9ROSI|nr:hypothetical protein K2173_015493 [Erythroxylum novogranatense]